MGLTPVGLSGVVQVNRFRLLASRNDCNALQVELADEKGDTRVIDTLSRYGTRNGPLAPEGSFGYQKWQVAHALMCS